LTGGKSNEKVKFEKIIPFVNETAINVNDMAAVEDINEVDLLNNMKNRFSQKNIHTNVGPTLIIMNPYQKVEGLYTEAKIDEFIKVKLSINDSYILLG
jgi:myosin heavy subunit